MPERFLFTSALQLLSGERLVFATRRHALFLLFPLLALALAGSLLLPALCGRAAPFRAVPRCSQAVSAALLISALPFLLDWLFTLFILTSERLIRLWAPLPQVARSLPLEEVASLSIEVGLLGRLFSYGQLRAESAASRTGDLRFDGVPTPERLHDLVATELLLRTLR